MEIPCPHKADRTAKPVGGVPEIWQRCRSTNSAERTFKVQNLKASLTVAERTLKTHIKVKVIRNVVPNAEL
jgi:hypothetical protein